MQDTRHRNLREAAPRFVYIPVFQPRERLGRLSLVVRTDGDASRLMTIVQRRVESLGPDILVSEAMTMRQHVDASLLRERLVATLCTFFGVRALLLSAVGLYGIVAHDVAGRTRELGIRAALGARPRAVIRLVIQETRLLALVGVAVGLPAALLAGQAVARLLYDLQPSDPATGLASAALLLAVATLAAWLPAHRAVRADPVSALRRE